MHTQSWACWCYARLHSCSPLCIAAGQPARCHPAGLGCQTKLNHNETYLNTTCEHQQLKTPLAHPEVLPTYSKRCNTTMFDTANNQTRHTHVQVLMFMHQVHAAPTHGVYRCASAHHTGLAPIATATISREVRARKYVSVPCAPISTAATSASV
jgi:hypothetical protein